MIRSPRSRQDLYANPKLGLYGSAEYDVAKSGVFRSRKTQESLRQRPESISSGYGNLRPVGQGTPYTSGIGRAAIEREDIGR